MKGLERVLYEIDRYTDEVVVRRFDGDEQCGCVPYYSRCRNKAVFEIRGNVRRRTCAQCIDKALDELLTPIRLDDMEGHIGRHSSIVTRKECADRPRRLQGERPKSMRDCYRCQEQRARKARCRCKNSTFGRCLCGAVVCGTCWYDHAREASGDRRRHNIQYSGTVYHADPRLAS